MTHSTPEGAVTETGDSDPHPAIAALQQTVAQLEARVAQLEQPPAQGTAFQVQCPEGTDLQGGRAVTQHGCEGTRIFEVAQ